MAIFKSIHIGSVIDAAITKVIDLASNLTGKGASLIAIEDADGNYTATDVEGALKESAEQISTKSPSASPTFTGTVVLPSTTSVGNVSSTELGYLDGVTGAIQTQITAKSPIDSPTFTTIVTAPTNTTYTTRQVRNVVLSTADASGGSNGDIWFKYTP